MNRIPGILAILAAVALVAADNPEKKEGNSDQELIQGTWEAVSIQQDGKINTKIVSYRLTLIERLPKGKYPVFNWKSETKVKQITKEGEEQIKVSTREGPFNEFSLGLRKKPKSIRFRFMLEMSSFTPQIVGIYKLEVDRLTMCTKTITHFRDSLPTDFTTKKGDGRILYALKRKKGEVIEKADAKKKEKAE